MRIIFLSIRKTRFPAIALLAFAFTSNSFAEFDAAAAASALPDQGEFHLAMFNNDEPDGFMRLGWHRAGEQLIVYDRTMMPSAEVYETYAALMSAVDFEPQSVAIRFHQGTATLNIEASFADGQISGERSVERIAQPIESTDFTMAGEEGTVLRVISFLLPLVLDTAPGQAISYEWFSPLAGQISTVTLTSSDGGEVVTPAGTFDTTRWELRGASPENDIYVARGESQRIVRIDVLGQPLKFLAITP